MPSDTEPADLPHARVWGEDAGVVAGGNVDLQGERVAARDETNIDTINVTMPAGAAPTPALYQLPRDVADFTGRDSELAKLRALLNQPQQQGRAGTVVISAIHGKPGVGKSALAIHLAHQLAGQFPDGQLYVNLRGPEQERLAPEEVLDRFLRTLGMAGEPGPTPLGVLVARYPSALSGKRMLVVLDNASSSRQVEPLVPASPACAVLVTSRQALTDLDGGCSLTLEVLDPGPAVELLVATASAERLPADSPAAGEIARLCGYLPLALRIAGARLATRRQWTPARLAARLTDERRRLDELRVGDREVRASFALSYQDLDEPAARAFRLLGILPAPDFTSFVVPELLEVDDDAAEQLLDQLVDAQLLEALAEVGRYRFHDLLRLFARERLAHDESDDAEPAARLRALAWYARMAAIMDALHAPQGLRRPDLPDVDPAMALHWFEAERLSLVAAVQAAFDARLWQLTCQLAESLVNFFGLRGYWKDWQHTQELALRAAGQAADRAAEGRALNNLGNAYQQQSRWDQAIDCFDRGLAISRELGDRHMEAETLSNLGNGYARQRRWDQAIMSYEQSLTICRELGDRHGEAQTLTNLGVAFREHGEIEAAQRCWDSAVVLLEHLGAPKAVTVRAWLAAYT
jgi:tetratricopeptide (TPR) repeat protein